MKNNTIRKFLCGIVLVLPVVLSIVMMMFVVGCSEQLSDIIDTVSGTGKTYIVLSDPSNNQAVLKTFDVTGSVYNTNGVDAIVVYATPVYGGATNTASLSYNGIDLLIYRGTMTVSLESWYYLWAEVTNKKGEVVATGLTLVDAKDSIVTTNTNNGGDTDAPVVVITTPTADQVVGSTYTFSGTVSDASGVAAVYVKLDSGTYSEVSVNNGIWSTSFTVSTSGNHINYVYAVDTEDNTSTPQTVTVNYQAGTPSITISAPVSGTVFNTTSINVNGSASVSGSTINTVELSVNGGSYANVGNTTWSTTGVALTEGANTLQARATAANALSSTSAIVSVTRDTIIPTINVVAPTANQVLTNNSVTVSGTAADTGSGVDKVYVAIDSGSYAVVNGKENWTVTINLPEGSHTVKAYSADKAQNNSTITTIPFAITNYDSPTPPTVSASPVGCTFSTTDFAITLSASGTSLSTLRYTLDGSDPASGGTTFTSGQVITIGSGMAQDESKDLRMYAVGTGGTASTQYTYIFHTNATQSSGDKPYSVNPSYGEAGKTIVIDGANTASEWSTANMIAIDIAGDDPRTLGGNWCMHECPWDLSHLYAAWDDNYLYIAYQYVDITDIADPANAGSSAGTKPNQMNMIGWIVFDTKAGGAPIDMWGKNGGEPYWNGADLPDVQIYIAGNLWQGFVSRVSNGVFPVDDGGVNYMSVADANIECAVANNQASSTLWGVCDIDNYDGTTNSLQDFIASGHDGGRDTFYEIKIPLSFLQITRSQIETSGIGVMIGQGEYSCMDTIPNDPATSDTPGTSDSNSPLEWADEDYLSVDFARIGHAK